MMTAKGYFGGNQPAKLTFIATRNDSSSDASSSTFTGVGFGGATSKDFIVVALAARGSSLHSTSMTIDGQTATKISFRSNFGECSIWRAPATGNASGTITVNFDGSERCAAFIYRLQTLNPISVNANDDIGSDPAFPLNIPANGAAVAVSISDGSGATWTGLTKDADSTSFGGGSASAASKEFVDAQTALNIQCTWSSGGNEIAAGVSFRPK